MRGSLNFILLFLSVTLVSCQSETSPTDISINSQSTAGNLEHDLIVKLNPTYQHNGAVNEEILSLAEANDRITAFIDGGVEGTDYLQRVSGDYTLYADESRLLVTWQDVDDVQIVTFNVTSHGIERSELEDFLDGIGIPVNIANELLEFIFS